MKCLIFDLDQTLIDTDELKRFRDSRDWLSVRKNISKISLYPGIRNLFQDARNKGYSIAVVTNLPSSICELCLNQVGLETDANVCYHDTIRHKPDPEPVIKALTILKADPRQSFGIGDSEKDIEAYNNAGLKPIFVTWSDTKATNLKAINVRHPDEIKLLI